MKLLGFIFLITEKFVQYFEFFFFKVYGYVRVWFICLCIYVHACGTYRGQKRISDPLELELQVVMSCLIWVQGTEIKPSGRASSILDL